MHTHECAVRALGRMYKGLHVSCLTPTHPGACPVTLVSTTHQGSVSTTRLSPRMDLPSQVCWLLAHSPAKISTWETPGREENIHTSSGKRPQCAQAGRALNKGLTLGLGDSEKPGGH